MNFNVLKLWKTLLKLAEVATDKATLIVDGDIAVGVEVFVENDGEYTRAEDGEYISDDKVIVVAEGKIAEVRDKESESDSEPEQEPEETAQDEQMNTAKDKFDAVKAQFEASYQEIEANIYSALNDAGVYGYLIENGNDYAIVSEWDVESDREHLYRYEISIDENGFVTLGTKKEVRVEYVDVDAAPETDERDERIAELQAQLAEMQAQLQMSADEPAKEKVKKEVKSGALRYFN